MKKTISLILLSLLSSATQAASMNCRVTEMIDFGQWSGFPKSQVQLDSKLAEVVQTQIGHNVKIDLSKIYASRSETTLIFKSASASEKLEIVIKPMNETPEKFHMTLTQLSYRAAVISTKSVDFSTTTVNVVRIGIDGNDKTMMAECEISPI
jgi:hypothetical protein